VLRVASELAAAHASKPRPVLAKIKQTMYRDVLTAIANEQAGEAARG
jgi:hypothetical protein